MESPNIDRALSTPLHQQVAEHLKELISTGTIAEGDELPSEGDLAKYYAVSRSVVRQAMSGLVADRQVATRKGRPATVITSQTKRPVRNISRAGGLTEDLRGQGKELLTSVISVEERNAPSFLRKQLFLEDCWEIHRLRTIDGEPIVYVINWVPKDLLPFLTQDTLQGRSLHELIRDTGAELVGGKRYMTAVTASEFLASQLEVEAGSPLLKVAGETRTTRNKIAEGFELWHHPSFDFEINASTVAAGYGPDVERIELALADLNDAISSAFPNSHKDHTNLNSGQ